MISKFLFWNKVNWKKVTPEILIYGQAHWRKLMVIILILCALGIKNFVLDIVAVNIGNSQLKTVQYVFKESEKTLNYYQDQFQYVMVDEYQDTNISQYRLTKYLAGKHNNICIVGDFSQSIYSFRGADYKNLEKFKNDFPEAKVFKLSQNYRSTQTILNAAHSIISNNNSHPVLKLWTDNKEGDEISIFEADNEHKEAEYIIKMINNQKSFNPTFNLSDVAVLYRMNAQSRTIEEVLLHYGIPYKLVGGVRFYDRKEVKDVLSYISYLSNQQDSVALQRIQKLGKRRFADFEFYRQEFNEGNYIEKKETLEIIDDVLKKSGYLDRYDKEDPEDRARLENIKELRSVALEFPDIIQYLFQIRDKKYLYVLYYTLNIK